MQVTQFTKSSASGVMTKSIKLGPDGKIISDASACYMTEGEAQTFHLLGVDELAFLISQCTARQAIALGAIRPEFRAVNANGEDKARTRVVAKKGLLKASPGLISRTKDCLEFPPGEDGALLIDHDRKGMPEAVRSKLIRQGGLWKTLTSIMPELAKAARIERASTSAGLTNTATGARFPDSGGLHFYLHVTDAADIPRATRALHDRCALAGYGWTIMSDAARSCTVRSSIGWSARPTTWCSRGRRK